MTHGSGTDRKSPEHVAADLAQYLTTQATTYGGQRVSPLEEILRQKITAMAHEVAAEVIQATPEIRSRVAELVQVTVQRALAEDTWLAQTVVSAVAGAITNLALERKHERED